MLRPLASLLALGISAAAAGPAAAQFHFSTGQPDGLIATATRPSGPGLLEIESADDFVVPGPGVSINHATFYGLIPTGVNLGDISQVGGEIYRVFPKDSTTPPSGDVPTRVNAPSDVAFSERDSALGNLSFSASILNTTFTAGNSVVNGIHPFPNPTTGGEGPVTGIEVLLDVSFTTPFVLPADHYFFVPQVGLETGNFLWLSAPKPISGPGTTPFTPDLQSWIRDENLAPDWLRVGTDIIGGQPAHPYNAAFSLDGVAVPESASTGWFVAVGALALAFAPRVRRVRSKRLPWPSPR